MKLHIEHGLLNLAQYLPSPNFNGRPENINIDLLVIHNISLPPGEYGGHWIDALFTNQLPPHRHPYFSSIANLKVSSHLLIDRKGHIKQYVPFHMRAWHAGISTFEGKENCNDYAIGIELEGCDFEPFETIQYQILANITLCLFHYYPKINKQRITGHENIAPDRKTDPGPFFDWSLYHRLLAQDKNSH